MVSPSPSNRMPTKLSYNSFLSRVFKFTIHYHSVVKKIMNVSTGWTCSSDGDKSTSVNGRKGEWTGDWLYGRMNKWKLTFNNSFCHVDRLSSQCCRSINGLHSWCLRHQIRIICVRPDDLWPAGVKWRSNASRSLLFHFCKRNNIEEACCKVHHCHGNEQRVLSDSQSSIYRMW